MTSKVTVEACEGKNCLVQIGPSKASAPDRNEVVAGGESKYFYLYDEMTIAVSEKPGDYTLDSEGDDEGGDDGEDAAA
jgi:hypothetical protein